MKSILVCLFLVSNLVIAKTTGAYADGLIEKIQKHQIADEELKKELFLTMSKDHKAVGYSPAKKFLFGQLHLKEDARGYYVEDVYCKKEFTKGAGPGNIPDQNQINCEHTWPQSKFTGSFPNEYQKSDLHHLFPTDSKANSTRGNYDFADVVTNINLGEDCNSSKSGASVVSGGRTYFEPPKEHKGNVARALFYFSVRYKIAINDQEEEFLRRWDEIDPVDQAEERRNDEIEKIQKNRNPFIDFPGLAQNIKNF